MEQSIHVLSLGGSLVYPEEINISFLKQFRRFITREIKHGKRFIIIVGGGGPARKFQDAAGRIVRVSDEDKDWIGIHATRMNAQLLRTIFKHEAHPVLLKNRHNVRSFDGHSLIIGAGWHPGWSTDFVAVQVAIDFGVHTVVNLGRAAYVYNKDNRRFTNAKPFHKLSWQEYMRYIPRKWTPGIHAPVDPVAAKLAKKHRVRVIVAGGNNFKNIRNILNGRLFKGTTIT